MLACFRFLFSYNRSTVDNRYDILGEIIISLDQMRMRNGVKSVRLGVALSYVFTKFTSQVLWLEHRLNSKVKQSFFQDSILHFYTKDCCQKENTLHILRFHPRCRLHIKKNMSILPFAISLAMLDARYAVHVGDEFVGAL